MTDWIVWGAQPQDADIVANIEDIAFGVRSWGHDNLKASFGANNVTTLLAGAAEDSPAGFAMWRGVAGEAEILTIGVMPAAQGRGVGSALLNAVLAGMRASNVHTAFLDVDAGNSPAISLYGKAGFEEFAVRRGYYRDGADAVQMRMALSTIL